MAILPDIFSFAVARDFKNHILEWCELDHVFVFSYVLVGNAKRNLFVWFRCFLCFQQGGNVVSMI